MADPIELLRTLALRHAGVVEGIACPGTAMERRTMKAGTKAFLFFGATDAMVKLAASIPEAKRLARAEPSRYRVGANGWVKATFTAAEPPPRDVFARWIAESYELMATKPKPRAKPRSKR